MAMDIVRRPRRARGRGDSIIFSKETERDLLLLLNEDLWAGDFSGDHYAAARKTRR